VSSAPARISDSDSGSVGRAAVEKVGEAAKRALGAGGDDAGTGRLGESEHAREPDANPAALVRRRHAERATHGA
jgi:hypothetical protein